MLVWTVPSSRPTSPATAVNTSSGDAPPATRVATRRSAACSSANPRSSVRAWALATAVATSSVNPGSRASASAGSDSSRVNATSMAPHSCPSIRIGTPADERSLHSRAAALPIAPETSL